MRETLTAAGIGGFERARAIMFWHQLSGGFGLSQGSRISPTVPSRYSAAGRLWLVQQERDRKRGRAANVLLRAEALNRQKTIFERSASVCSSLIRVRAYAHDRITISAVRNAAIGNGKGRHSRQVVKLRGRSGFLDIQRGSQRGIKIGNRWRVYPMKTDWTTRARNWVMDAAHIVEHHAKGRGLFVTLTYPGGTEDGYKCMAHASGYLVNRLNRWLQSRLIDNLSVHVWELQKRGAPHLHYLFRVPESYDVSTFTEAIRSEWRAILESVSDETGIDLFEREDGGTWRGNESYPVVDVRELSHTYAQYISKYASKAESKGNMCAVFRPGRWYGISKQARTLARARRLDVTLGFCDDRDSGKVFAEFAQAILESPCNSWIKPNRESGEVSFVSAQFAVGSGLSEAKRMIANVNRALKAMLFCHGANVFVRLTE